MIIGPAVRWGCHYKPIGGGRTTITKITNNYNNSCTNSCGGGMSWLGGLMSFLPMMFMAIPFLGNLFGRKNNPVQEQQLAQQQQQQPADPDLTNLKDLYGDKFKVVKEKDGTYTAVNKDDPKIKYEGTYQQIKDAISNAGTKASVNNAARQDEIKPEDAQKQIEDMKLQDKIKIEDGKIKYTDPTDNTEKELPLTQSNLNKTVGKFIEAKLQNKPTEGNQSVDGNSEGNIGNTVNPGESSKPDKPVTQDSLNKALKNAKLPEGAITLNADKNEITYKGKDGKTVTVPATKENIAAAIKALKPAAQAPKAGGTTWKVQEDGAFSNDAQFVSADGKRTYEIQEKSAFWSHPDHLNMNRFDVKDGESITVKNGYEPNKILLVPSDSAINNGGVEIDGVKQEYDCKKDANGTIWVRIRNTGNDKKDFVKLEDFLNKDYPVPQKKINK